MPDSGNVEQVRLVAEQVADAAILRFASRHPEMVKQPVEAPPMVKWLVGAIAAFGSAALIGLGFWLVTSVSSMRETLARMDERQSGADTAQIARDAEQDRRITKNEAAIAQLNGDGGR